MGKQYYQKQVEALFKKTPVVSFKSIEMIIRARTKNKTLYAKQLIRNLLLADKIKTIAKGYYSLYDDPNLLAFCYKPSYLGLQDALSFHNLWEQETIPIIITYQRVRQGIRKVQDINVLVRRLDKKYFFGIEYHQVGDFYFPYSDIEKTFIDMVYFKQKTSKDLLHEFKKRLDSKKVKRYLKQYPHLLRLQVLKLLS
ncbi:hypothetical protein HYY69_03495 [Candidatus Woesearchaeota archaeon]|nr:hypothetical protein [Candidatus Woesearchaeota archaeon]